jgi:hypothetical protein
MQARVFGLVDDAHAASANFFKNTVVGDGPADERVGVRHSAALLGLRSWQANDYAWLAVESHEAQPSLS